MNNKKVFNLAYISEVIKGKLYGDANFEVSGIKSYEKAGPDDITFSEKSLILKDIIEKPIGAVITNEKVETDKNIIVVENPKLAWTSCIDLFYNEPEPERTISPQSFVDKTAHIGNNVYIGHFTVIEKNAQIGDNVLIYPNCYIGANTVIAENTKLYPGVKLYYDTVIGKNCIIHSNTVIGADGFGFVPSPTGLKKIYQIGNVVVKDNVEIGANSTIDRATTASTVIGNNVKLDDHVHIAHNCEIGDYTVLAGTCALAGSVKVGKAVTMAGQTAVAPHINIGNNVTIGGKSGVISDIKDNTTVSGFPAKDHNLEKKIIISTYKLPEIIKKNRDLFSSVKRISHRLESIEKYLNLKFRKDN